MKNFDYFHTISGYTINLQGNDMSTSLSYIGCYYMMIKVVSC